MATVLEEIQQDELAMVVARAVAIANETATAQGADPAASLISIVEETPPPARTWRVHYGQREFKRQRGGDLIVLVDEATGSVQRIIRGQ